MAIRKRSSRDDEQNETTPARRSQRPSSFQELQNEMNRMFENFFGGGSMMEPWSGSSSSSSMMQQSGRFTPRIDVTENTESVNVTAELPGMNKDDIELFADENGLTLKGEKRVEETQEDEGFYRNERSYGYFRRTIPFPVEVDTDNVEAKFDEGVLRVRVPKTGESKGKRLEIK
jgi:HSP20 family protein